MRSKKITLGILILVFWAIISLVPIPFFKNYIDTLIVEVLFLPFLKFRVRLVLNLSTLARLLYFSVLYLGSSYQDPGVIMILFVGCLFITVQIQRWALIGTLRKIGYYSRITKTLGIG